MATSRSTASRAHLYVNKGDLAEGDIGQHLLRLTLPTVWGLVAAIGVQLTDMYFISRLGTRELAGISFTFPVTMVLTHFLFGINIALSSVLARLLGEKKTGDARRITLHGILFGVALAALVCFGTYLALDPLFSLMGADAESLTVIRDFMPLWLISTVILAIPVNSNSAMRAGGDTFIPMIVMVSMALINLVLNPVFVFGLLGVPAMGVTGSALATLIAHIISLFLALYFLVVKKDMVARDGLHLDKMIDSLKRLSVIAIPAGITNVIGPAASGAIVHLLASAGPEIVAGYGISVRVEAFTMIAMIALALGMAPMVGQNWGAARYDRVEETLRLSFRFNILWSLGMAAILWVFAYPIARLFSDHPDVVDTTAQFFRIVPISYAAGNLIFGWSSAFNAMGKPARSFLLITGKSLATVLAAYAGFAYGGITGVFWSLALTNIALGLAAHALCWRACRRDEALYTAAVS